jgi:hypothetical protein
MSARVQWGEPASDGPHSPRVLLQADVIRQHFKAIYVVDVSPSLLDVAQRRIKAMELGHIVKTVEYDFTSPTIFKKIAHLEGAVDMVRRGPDDCWAVRTVGLSCIRNMIG